MTEKQLKVQALLAEFKEKHESIVIQEEELSKVEGAGDSEASMIVVPIPGCCGQDTKSDGCMSSPTGPRC